MDIEGLKLKEISLFLDLVKIKSVRGLARQRGELPGQISKSIRSLEVKLGNPLIHRSTLGISLTSYALEILPYLEGIRNYQQRLGGHLGRAEQQSVLSFATTSFFSSHVLPQIFGKLEKEIPDVHCRMIDLPPHQFVQVGLRNGFEVCIHLQELEWPRTWTSVMVGKVQWQLCCRTDHPIGKKPSLKSILNFPFIYPVYWTAEGLRHGSDHFPVSMKKRIKGHETATATSAAEVVAHTDHLGFLPHLVIQPLVQNKKLQILNVPDYQVVEEPVYLTVKSDAIKQQRFEWLKKNCHQLLQSSIPKV